MSTSPKTAKQSSRQAAQHHLKNFAAFIRRDVTGWVRDRDASYCYERALVAVVAVEDRVGVDEAWPLISRLRDLYYEARTANLLADEDIFEIESRVLA